MSDREYSAKDKIVSQMTRDGLVEINVTQGTCERVSKRLSESSFDKETVHEEAFQGHSRFDADAGKASPAEKHTRAARKLEKQAEKSGKQLEKLEKKVEKQQKRADRSKETAKTLLPRIRIRRKEMYRSVVDPATGKEERELYRYGIYRPRLVRVIKKPANTFTLRERAVRAGKRKAAREAENKVFEGEGSENAGLQAAHGLYRKYRFIHWYLHRKDYLKSYRHVKYRAYKESREKLHRLTEARHKMAFEAVADRHVANVARFGEAEANKMLTGMQKNMLLREAQKRAYKKKYQRAKYAEQHTDGTGIRMKDIIRKRVRQKRELQATKEVASMFGSIAGSVLFLLGAFMLVFWALLFFVFLCASYVGTTDTDSGNITECDACFSEKETELRDEILKIEEENEDFDEYRYFVNGEQVSGAQKMAAYINHDPVLLSSFLAVSNDNYEMQNSAELMDAIFNAAFSLEYKEVTEQRTDDEGDDYDVEILEIYLTVKEFDQVLKENMNDNQKQQWELLNYTGGNQQIFSNPFDFDWSGHVSSKYGWRIHPISGVKKFHAGVDIAEPRGTQIHACSRGTVITATFSSSAGNYIAVRDEDGFVVKYMHCHELYVKKGDVVERGDIIAIVGTTGNSTGNHLHLQIEDPSGNTLNPLFLVRS